MRVCPFCGESRSTRYGERGNAVWVRCAGCRSIHRDLTPEAFGRLHDVAFLDDDFASRTESALGREPDGKTWREVRRALGAARGVLEIGPGTGHVLAAAKHEGCAVAGIETSATHRDVIARLWNIATYPSFESLPPGAAFDAVVAINVIEHVYDVDGFLRAIAATMEDGGRCFISTVNASALTARLCGTGWAMFKELDHVSFPTAGGLRAAARRSGLDPVRVWSAELPLETPVSLLVAARDAWRGQAIARDGGQQAPAAPHASGQSAARSALNRMYRLGPLEPTAAVLGALGVGGSVKAVFEKPRRA